jgi:hypothetical protein
MLKPLVALLVLTTFAIATAGCGAAMREGSTTDARTSRPTAFESWAVGNATGTFLRPLGPAGGTGVR